MAVTRMAHVTSGFLKTISRGTFAAGAVNKKEKKYTNMILIV